MNKFAERLKELREEKGLTQKELSLQTGLAQSSIAHWENNQRIPNIEVAMKFAIFFKVSVDYIVGQID